MKIKRQDNQLCSVLRVCSVLNFYPYISNSILLVPALQHLMSQLSSDDSAKIKMAGVDSHIPKQILYDELIK